MKTFLSGIISAIPRPTLRVAWMALLVLGLVSLASAGYAESVLTDMGNEAGKQIEEGGKVGAGLIVGIIWLCALIGIGIIFATNSMKFNVMTIAGSLGVIIAASVGSVVVVKLKDKAKVTISDAPIVMPIDMWGGRPA